MQQDANSGLAKGECGIILYPLHDGSKDGDLVGFQRFDVVGGIPAPTPDVVIDPVWSVASKESKSQLVDNAFIVASILLQKLQRRRCWKNSSLTRKGKLGLRFD